MRHLILIWFDAFYCDKKALNEFSSGLAYCMWMFRGGLVLYFLFFLGPWPTVKPFHFFQFRPCS